MSDDVERIRRRLREIRECTSRYPRAPFPPSVDLAEAEYLLAAYDREVERRRDLEREVDALRSDAEFRSMRDWLAGARKELTATEWRLAREVERRKAAEALIDDLASHISAVSPDSSAWIEDLAPRVDSVLAGAPDNE